MGIHLVSNIYGNSRLKHASTIKYHKLWCKARTMLLPVPQADRMLAFKLINYFSSYPAVFGFWASSPPDNITLIPANKKTDQRFFFPMVRLALVQLFLPLQTQSSLSLIPQLLMLIHMPLYRVMMVE